MIEVRRQDGVWFRVDSVPEVTTNGNERDQRMAKLYQEDYELDRAMGERHHHDHHERLLAEIIAEQEFGVIDDTQQTKWPHMDGLAY